MSATAETPETELTPELIERVMKLSPENREKFALLLLDSLDGPPDDPEEVRKGWKDEIARRVEDVQAGRVGLVDADQALAEMRQRLRGG
jgi:putative addiction module component (TIGR02574 family)